MAPLKWVQDKWHSTQYMDGMVVSQHQGAEFCTGTPVTEFGMYAVGPLVSQ